MGLLALDWSYPWRTRHETRKDQIFTEPWADCGHQKTTQFLTIHYFNNGERLHNGRVTGLGFICEYSFMHETNQTAEDNNVKGYQILCHAIVSTTHLVKTGL